MSTSDRTVLPLDTASIRARAKAATRGDGSVEHPCAADVPRLCDEIERLRAENETLASFAARTSDEKMLLLREARETQQPKDGLCRCDQAGCSHADGGKCEWCGCPNPYVERPKQALCAPRPADERLQKVREYLGRLDASDRFVHPDNIASTIREIIA